MGEHVDEFMAKYRRGEIIGECVVAAMAEQAILADKAADQAKGRRLAAARPHPAEPPTPDYDELFMPTAARVDRYQRAVAARVGELDAMDDDTLFTALFPAPADATHDAFSGTHGHVHADGRGGYHAHGHSHDGNGSHGHHALQG